MSVASITQKFSQTNFFVSPMFFGLWVMETEFYNSVFTQTKQPLASFS